MVRRRLRAASRLSLPAGLEHVPEPVARHFVNLGGFEIALFLRRLTPSPGRVLVIGVGAGRDYYYLGLRNEVIALDLVTQSTVPSAILADFSEEIPLPAKSIDAVVISDVLEHVFDDRRALTNCRTVLKDDGCLILNVPYGDDIGDHHVRVYTRATVYRLLLASGFHAVEEVERGPLAHLDRYWPWRALYHGVHLMRFLVSGDPGYDRTLRWLTAVDWWFGHRRLSPARFSKRHGAYIKAVKAQPRDFTQVNRELYVDQGSRQLSGA
jgi:SAM-dependent methyltransferase